MEDRNTYILLVISQQQHPVLVCNGYVTRLKLTGRRHCASAQKHTSCTCRWCAANRATIHGRITPVLVRLQGASGDSGGKPQGIASAAQSS